MVDETTDPNVCVMGGTPTIDIVVTTTGGAFAGEFEANCADFSTTISSLAEGAYTATADLRDSGGRPRTTAVVINPFTIVANSDLVIDVDFPASAFLD
jgi:hypothetical protein